MITTQIVKPVLLSDYTLPLSGNNSILMSALKKPETKQMSAGLLYVTIPEQDSCSSEMSLCMSVPGTIHKKKLTPMLSIPNVGMEGASGRKIWYG